MIASALQLLGLALVVVAGALLAPALGLALAGAALFLVGHVLDGE